MTEPKKERTRSTKEQIAYEIREILDLKAQGWSDRQIRKELSNSRLSAGHGELTQRMYEMRKAVLRDSDLFKREALEFLNETVHRLRFLRMKAYTDYSEWRNNRQYNAAAAAFRRVVEIDTSLPRICVDLGWSVDELNNYYRKEDSKTRIPETEDELRQAYKELVKSEC